ncbi:uroporphyrinogen-III synthase [Poseidonibacter lekithochrous]|uniref:uroporphyrinogen-III synthase n=1 Tax=Poseidonibacter TaxID=2321187 RepID=UPI001C082D41|nr:MULTISPECIES: uroporphyrinogen-III synthase [Poseidonibacter]MBU3014983.1 uroporphyrinogen-III synthase [Poseidonibacter lekithochrous]MDO6828280.1 uroporphyrinogen-III synthase [Poseidonibacter sp. 1_MG-2023]
MDIKKIINSLDLIYYEYDEKKKILIKDINYSNRFTEMEFLKITYHLSKVYVPFEVLKNKTISLEKTKFNIKKYFSQIIDKTKTKNIYLLNNYKIKGVKNIPLFKIEYINKKIDFSKYDAIIFTSKNAINAINSFNKAWKNIPSYVISEQTAKLVKDLNGKIEYISKIKHGDEFAYEILTLLKNKKVLYLRGKEIVSNLINILSDNKIQIDDEIIYENCFDEAVKTVEIPKNSKIIFTSPSTIEYFFKVFSWDESYQAISIGKTTAQYFPKNIKPIIADNTSFKSCVDKALELEV